MGHPRVRTWTLGTLDRGVVYRLWFDAVEHRWEVRPEGQDTGTVTTRPTTAVDRGALAAAKRGGGAVDAVADGGAGAGA